METLKYGETSSIRLKQMSPSKADKAILDEKDLSILSVLRNDASKSAVQISTLLGLPRSTVQERIRRMKRRRLIKRFTVIPNYASLGEATKAYILVSLLPEPLVSHRELAERIARLEGVYEADLVSGEWDLLLKVRARSMQEIGELVIEKLRTMGGVGRTVTCVSFSTVKDDV